MRHILGNPDVIGLEETGERVGRRGHGGEDQRGCDRGRARRIRKYVAYGTGTDYAPYTNDVGGISVGFLVKSTTVDTVSIQQLGANNLFTDPRNGSTQQTLNDRPPLVLHAGIKRANAKDYPVTVIVNHLRSLSSENDPSTGVFVRDKKELQAEFLANLIQGYQSAGEHVVSVGDYNAFEFSDGVHRHHGDDHKSQRAAFGSGGAAGCGGIGRSSCDGPGDAASGGSALVVPGVWQCAGAGPCGGDIRPGCGGRRTWLMRTSTRTSR